MLIFESGEKVGATLEIDIQWVPWGKFGGFVKRPIVSVGLVDHLHEMGPVIVVSKDNQIIQAMKVFFPLHLLRVCDSKICNVIEEDIRNIIDELIVPGHVWKLDRLVVIQLA